MLSVFLSVYPIRSVSAVQKFVKTANFEEIFSRLFSGRNVRVQVRSYNRSRPAMHGCLQTMGPNCGALRYYSAYNCSLFCKKKNMLFGEHVADPLDPTY